MTRSRYTLTLMDRNYNVVEKWYSEKDLEPFEAVAAFSRENTKDAIDAERERQEEEAIDQIIDAAKEKRSRA